MKFRTRAYGSSSKQTIKNNHQCSSTIFTKNNQPAYGKPAKRDELALDTRADGDVRLDWVKNRLIASEIEELTAKELCDSDLSYGPDFLDSSGMFCEMGSKTLYPTCSLHDIVGCVELDGLTILQKVTDVLDLEPFKTYNEKQQWTEDD